MHFDLVKQIYKFPTPQNITTNLSAVVCFHAFHQVFVDIHAIAIPCITIDNPLPWNDNSYKCKWGIDVTCPAAYIKLENRQLSRPLIHVAQISLNVTLNHNRQNHPNLHLRQCLALQGRRRVVVTRHCLALI